MLLSEGRCFLEESMIKASNGSVIHRVPLIGGEVESRVLMSGEALRLAC